jgi:lipopolysaccharide/colanic/teichoic acid biosynthesis glycosyltransferase
MANQTYILERISRAVDIIVAGVALILLSPVMLVIIVCIYAEIGRPVFFSQKRLGLNGEAFRIHKFRKFCVPNDAPGPLLTVRNDPRMSRIGGLLESSKLDELPQFYNVLKGDMAIVGPRPDNGVAGDCFIGKYRALLDHKPGIFGPGQTAFRTAGALYPPHVDRHEFYREVILPLKAEIDLSYYPRRTLLKDLLWMIRGILVVVGLYPTVRELPHASASGCRASAGEGRSSLTLGAASAASQPGARNEVAAHPEVHDVVRSRQDSAPVSPDRPLAPSAASFGRRSPSGAA